MSRTFIPPPAVAAEARKGLALRAAQPPSNRCCTSVGLRRAAQLANRQPVSVDTLKRMRSYFQRHAVDSRSPRWGTDSKGWIAWLAWGGDAGRVWCNQMLAKVEPTSNPRPIPLNQEVVQAIYDAVVDALEQARKAAHKGDLLYDALNRTKLQRGHRKGSFVLGTFPIPVYRGSKFAPLYREVPVMLWPSVEKRQHWLYGGAVPINEDDPTADLPYLAIKYTAILPVADLPRNLHSYTDRYGLTNTIVHEMTHAADFFRLRKHVPSGQLRKEKGDAAYYNQPMEVRAYMQAAVRGFKEDLRSDPQMDVEDWLHDAKSGAVAYWKHLTPANQRKFLQALYAAKQEFMAERNPKSRR